jgi:hypothetical protein
MSGGKTGRVLEACIAVLLSLLIIVSLIQVYECKKEFTVLEALYSPNGEDFRRVNLPFFAGHGYFTINFKTNKKTLDIILFAKECVEYLCLDGEVVYTGICDRCMHCSGLKVVSPIEGGAGDMHTIEVKTGGARLYSFFFIEGGENEFHWRLTAFLSALALLAVLFLIFSGRSLSSGLRSICCGVQDNGTLILLLMVSLFIQLIILPAYRSSDIKNWTVWTENLIHKKDFDFTLLDADYTHMGSGYMNKPPGAHLYPLAVLRLLFGFNHIYLNYLVKMPAVFGHLLLGYVIWSILDEKTRNKKITVLGTALYLFNPGAIIQAAYLGKSDSLFIALLLFALRSIKGAGFPLYYGLSVVCKQSSLFLLPWLLIQKRMFRQVFTAGAIVVLLCLPFLVYNPLLFIDRLITTHIDKSPKHLSWIMVLPQYGINVKQLDALIWFYILFLMIIAYAVKADAYTMGGIVFSLFIVFSKVVHEQYVLWGLPFLLLVFLLNDRTPALLAYLVSSFTCATMYETYHLLLTPLRDLSIILLALTLLFSSMDLIVSSIRQETTRQKLSKTKKQAD